MTNFASAHAEVGEQYVHLEDALAPALAPSESVDKEVRYYACRVLSKLAPELHLSSDQRFLDESTARRLLEHFYNAVVIDERRKQQRTLSAGDVALTFSCLVYHALSQSTNIPSNLQRDFILEACDIAEARPLPVLRWTEFVRSNLSDVPRLRTVMRSCIYSKTLLEVRMDQVFSRLSDHLLHVEHPRILAIGSSSTVFGALRGLARSRKIDAYLARPTPFHSADPSSIGLDVHLIDGAASPTDVGGIAPHLVVMGCAVVGKTEGSQIEVVNWARDISLAKHARQTGIPLVVIGGLYKIWPQSFYELHRDLAVDLRKGSSPSQDAILTQDDIDWFVTEVEAVSYPRKQAPTWIQFLLGAKSLDVTSGISLCANKEAFIQHALADQNIYKIDRILGQLSMDDRPIFERYKRHPEDYAYLKTGELPEQFIAAQRYYEDRVRDPDWRRKYDGKFIAILGTTLDMIVEDNLAAVQDQAYTKWGFRPIFHTRVTEPDKIKPSLPPPEANY